MKVDDYAVARFLEFLKGKCSWNFTGSIIAMFGLDKLQSRYMFSVLEFSLLLMKKNVLNSLFASGWCFQVVSCLLIQSCSSIFAHFVQSFISPLLSIFNTECILK
uniref:Uncharacterized protein n=1 Tax=Arundo donax TaxID=35708 RepID=A0A0A9AD40_ARUDO